MTPDEFISRFVAAEGDWAIDALERARRTEPVTLEFNVWILHIDPSTDTLRYEHEFDPHEGSLPLHEFVAGLQARLEASGG